MMPSSLGLAVASVTFTCIYLILRWIYRLFLHPLARFPGPRAAAMSGMFGMSYDLPRKTSYVKEFPAWHDKYGPIIRIEPNHLHIRDINAYNQVHKMGSRFDKDFSLYSFPFSKGSVLNTLSNKQARGHRDMYAPYFSRTAIIDLESVIKQNLADFLGRLEAMAAQLQAIDLTRGFKCLTADTTMRYSFNASFNALSAPEFKHELLDPVEAFLNDPSFKLGWYLPNLNTKVANLCMRFPNFAIKLNPSFACALDQVAFCRARILELKQQKSINGPCVFSTPLNPNPKKGHPVLDDATLGTDGWIFFFGGTDTSAGTLAFGVWHLLSNPRYLRQLQDELKGAIPHAEDLSCMEQGWVDLEKLDFLRAVVKESLRLFYGVVGRNPRVVPSEGATLCGEHIPGGTVISMSTYVYHHNPAYFCTHPYNEFRPERWLKKEDSDWNDQFWVPFMRGSRSCLGQNLGLATLYLTFAYVFRRCELELFETTEEDMEWHDAVVPVTSGHLKVKARRMQD